MGVGESELRGQPKTANNMARTQRVLAAYWPGQCTHCRALLGTRPPGRQDPNHEAMPNNVKIANHLQAEHNEATNTLQEVNIPQSNSKGESQRQSCQG